MLCGGDVVILYEDDADDVLGVRVVINQVCDGVDELNNRLGAVVARRGLGTKDESTLRHGFALVLDAEVEVKDVEGVHQLALVLVQALNLHVKDGIRVDFSVLVVVYPLRKVALIGLLDGDQFS